MKIVDQRVQSAQIPVTLLLEDLLKRIEPRHLTGIRRIILLDRDCRRRKKPSIARYVPIRGTRTAEIELYMEHLLELPDRARKNRIYLARYLLKALLHEIYHHRIRGLRTHRKPPDKKEEIDADRWASETMAEILSDRFGKEVFESEMKQIFRGGNKPEV